VTPAVQPLVAAWVLALATGSAIVPGLRRLKAGQVVRSDGPRTHAGKAGTPTMGGLIFLLALSGAALWWGPRTGALYVLLFSAWSFGLLGWADDFLKVVVRRPLGLRARYKVAGQLVLAAAIVAASLQLGRGTIVEIPCYGPLDLGRSYWMLGMLVVLSAANAVNLTDGLDGLAAGATACSFLAHGLMAWSLGEDAVVTFCLATVGSLVGFLRYNVYPARVFMGDTGSLALGAALGASAILIRTEILLVLVGGLYVAEALSVILQVFWFHVFGRRILRMSPLHHHFELSGWPEPRVVEFFWACSAVCAFLGLLVWRGMG
jgi:phospho-N-acetylmuramoyl-pentapeptide-transferase